MEDSLYVLEQKVLVLSEKVDHAYSIIENADLFISSVALLFGIVTIFVIGNQVYHTRELKNAWRDEMNEKSRLSESLARLSERERTLETSLDKFNERLVNSNTYYRNLLNTVAMDIINEIIYTLHSSSKFDDEVINLLLNRTYFRKLLIRLHTNNDEIIETCYELHFFSSKGREYLPEFKDCISTIEYLETTDSFDSYTLDRLIHLKVEMDKRISELNSFSYSNN